MKHEPVGHWHSFCCGITPTALLSKWKGDGGTGSHNLPLESQLIPPHSQSHIQSVSVIRSGKSAEVKRDERTEDFEKIATLRDDIESQAMSDEPAPARTRVMTLDEKRARQRAYVKKSYYRQQVRPASWY